MHAESFLGTLRYASDRASSGLSKRSYDGGREWQLLEDALEAVCDLAELCAVSIPLPADASVVQWSGDDRMAWLLDAMYDASVPGDGTGGSVDGPATADGGIDASEPWTERLPAARVREVGGTVVVPLRRSGPRAANWYVLFKRLSVHADRVAGDFRRLAGRLRVCDEEALADAWTALAELIDDVAEFVEYAYSAARWASLPDRGVLSASRETLSIAERLTSERDEDT